MAIAAKKEPTESRESLTGDLAWLLSRAAWTLGTELTAGLAELGLGPRGLCVLSTAMTGELTQTELAQAVGVDKTTMVVTIDELETAGLATRRPSTHDRRARIIGVTNAGERKVAAGKEIVARIQDDVLAALPARDRQVFVDALARLVTDRLAEPAECQPPVRRRQPHKQ